jgi:hypothetical protein
MMTVSDLLEQPCSKSDNIDKVVTTVNKLFHIYLLTTWDERCELVTRCEILRVYIMINDLFS